MKKIIITGHPSSDPRAVENRLVRWGMQPARPSRRENLSPQEIHQTLKRACDLPELPSISDESGFQAPAIAPVWHGLALDLMLGNQDQEAWGWSDPDSLFFLDYWCALDPEFRFVFLYDSPSSALPTASGGIRGLTEESIDAAFRNWHAYHGALLRFFLRHADRCLLFHRTAVESDPQAFSAALEAKLGIRFAAQSASWDLADNPAVTPGQDGPPADFQEDRTERFSVVPHAQGPAVRFLARQLLESHPECAAMYEELQAAADRSYPEEQDPEAMHAPIWISWLREREEQLRKTAHLEKRCHGMERDLEALGKDRETLRLQYAQACEELDFLWARHQQGEARVEELQSQLEHALQEPAPPSLTGAADRIKQQLSYRIGSQIVSLSKNPLGILLLPFALLGEALVFRRELRTGRSGDLRPLDEYADRHEAERVKKQLSYRIGNAVVRRAKSPAGWLVMPFAVIRQIQAFHHSRSPRA